MFFRRDRGKKWSFADAVAQLRSARFETTPLPDGSVKVSRNGIAAVIEDAGDRALLRERVGVILGSEIATLIDGGFQKFFRAPSGARRPALAAELKAVHEFEEDLKESLGLTSLYNQALGSVSTLYLYDRVTGRDSAAPKKAWEKQLRDGNRTETI